MRRLLTTFFLSMAFIGNLNARESSGLLILTVDQNSSVEVRDYRNNRIFKDNVEAFIKPNDRVIHRRQILRIPGTPPFRVIISNPEGVRVRYEGKVYPAPSKTFQVPAVEPPPPRTSPQPLPTGQVPVYPRGYSLSKFFSLGDGTNLRQYDSPKLCSSSCCAGDRKGLLGRRWGRGETFGVEQQRWYEDLRSDPGVRYVLRDLQTGTVLAKSQDAEKSWYGASAAKIFIVGALLHANNGSLDPKEWQRVFRLLIRSRNADWTPVQNAAGGGRAVDEFVQETLGLTNTRGQRSQNQINAVEATQFLQYAHQNKFHGAEALLRVMANNCWASRRSQKYLPTNIAVGSKTGFWKSFTHEIAYVEVDGKRYGVTVLTNTHVSDSQVSKISGREAVAIVVAGLVRTHLL